MTSLDPVVDIDNLSVSFATDIGTVDAVRDVSLDVAAGEVLAIVGESGSGKTVTARSILGLLPETALTRGAIMLTSKDGLFDKARGRVVGSDHYLTKPFTREELLAAIQQNVN